MIMKGKSKWLSKRKFRNKSAATKYVRYLRDYGNFRNDVLLAQAEFKIGRDGKHWRVFVPKQKVKRQ
jgi:hypothetical protein